MAPSIPAPITGSLEHEPPPGELPGITEGTQEPSWIPKIRGYLKDNILPEDDMATERITRQAKRYTMVDGELYRCSTDRVLLKCISKEEGRDLLMDIHGGECDSHVASCMLVGKVFR